MKVYRYKARNRESNIVNDILEAIDKGDAVRKLKRLDLVPIEINELRMSKLNNSLNITLTSGVSKKDLIFFLSQLYNLLHAGLGIIESLKIIIDQTTNKYLKKYLVVMLQDIRNGSSLYDAMYRQKKVFPKLMIEMIKVGESIGNLEEVVYDLHIYYEKQLKTINDIKSAMIYPLFLLVATIAVTIFLLVTVIPEIQGTIEASGAKLPLATRIVLNTSSFLQNYFFYLMFMILIIIIGLILYNRTDKGKDFYSKIALKAPIFGKINRKGNLVKISRTYSTLLKNKVNAIESLEIVRNILSNQIYKKIVDKSIVNISNGIPFSKAYEKNKYIDPVFSSMLAIGEETATLDEMLESVSEYYDAEMDAQVNTLKKMLEPIMIVVLVAIVGTIVLAVMLPMLTMLEGGTQ